MNGRLPGRPSRERFGGAQPLECERARPLCTFGAADSGMRDKATRRRLRGPQSAPAGVRRDPRTGWAGVDTRPIERWMTAVALSRSHGGTAGSGRAASGPGSVRRRTACRASGRGAGVTGDREGSRDVDAQVLAVTSCGSGPRCPARCAGTMACRCRRSARRTCGATAGRNRNGAAVEFVGGSRVACGVVRVDGRQVASVACAANAETSPAPRSEALESLRPPRGKATFARVGIPNTDKALQPRRRTPGNDCSGKSPWSCRQAAPAATRRYAGRGGRGAGGTPVCKAGPTSGRTSPRFERRGVFRLPVPARPAAARATNWSSAAVILRPVLRGAVARAGRAPCTPVRRCSAGARGRGT